MNKYACTILTLSACLVQGAPIIGLPVSTVHLIARPDEYKGKLVTFTGVLVNTMESGVLVYNSKEAALAMRTKEAVCLIFSSRKTPEEESKLWQLNGKYVYVRGIFEPDTNPDALLCFGAIRDVTRLEENVTAERALERRQKSDGIAKPTGGKP